MKKKEKFISKCCVCNKVKRKSGFKFSNRTHMDEWDHHEEDIKQLHNEFNIIISHGMCESCAEKWPK